MGYIFFCLGLVSKLKEKKKRDDCTKPFPTTEAPDMCQAGGADAAPAPRFQQGLDCLQALLVPPSHR